jgi:hypothetical protein
MFYKCLVDASHKTGNQVSNIGDYYKFSGIFLPQLRKHLL